VKSIAALAISLALIFGTALLVRRMFAEAWNSNRNEGQELGELLPKFTFKDLSGAQFNTENIDGQDILFMFLRVDCSHCRVSLPVVQNASAELQKHGIKVLFVSESDLATTRDLAKEFHITSLLLLDEDRAMTKLFKLRHTPSFLYYRSDKLFYKATGSDGIYPLLNSLKVNVDARPEYLIKTRARE
ncbi:MAG: TlpA family protein disulfide reductase, partial [Pyrinomonadaceae bacterium]